MDLKECMEICEDRRVIIILEFRCPGSHLTHFHRFYFPKGYSKNRQHACEPRRSEFRACFRVDRCRIRHECIYEMRNQV